MVSSNMRVLRLVLYSGSIGSLTGGTFTSIFFTWHGYGIGHLQCPVKNPVCLPAPLLFHLHGFELFLFLPEG